jgi:hypothetical protein
MGKAEGLPRFCTKNWDACRYSTHQDNKANVSCYRYYIQCPRANTAQLHPLLSMICIEVPGEDDFPELETRLQPMDVWGTYINAINEHMAMNKAGAVTGMEEEDKSEDAESPVSSTWTRVLAPPLASFTRDAASMKTPGRPTCFLVPPQHGVNNMTNEEETWRMTDIDLLDPDPLELTTSVQSELLPKWGELMALNWNKLCMNLCGLGQVVHASKDANRESFESLHKELSAISNKIAVLNTRIGVNTTVEGMVLVWEAVEVLMGNDRLLGGKFAAVEKRQMEVEKATKGISNDRLTDRRDLNFLLQNFDSLAKNYTENVGKLKSKLSMLESDKQSREVREAAGLSTSSGRNFGSRDLELETLTSRLESKIHKIQEDGNLLRRHIKNLQTSRDMELDNYGQGSHSRSDPIQIDLTATKQMEILESRMTKIESHQGGVIYSSHKFILSSQHDVERFIDDKKVESCGVYWDLFSVLVRMGGKKHSGQQLGQSTFTATRVQMTTLELDLLSSMSFEQPMGLFVSDAAETDTLKCSSFDNWIGIGLSTSVAGTIVSNVIPNLLWASEVQ